MNKENETIRELKLEKVARAKARLGDRPDYPDTPEQIAETEAMIESLAHVRQSFYEEDNSEN